MDAPEISVYGEAKGEYTRQLCVFLVPCLESYMLELLEEAKKDAPTPQKVLWHFQSLLQAIPDWNQNKVLQETDRIQRESKCDYLEELLTAVFIAHTKVLSAIRLTTKQKKLQITIPKLDHFLHRVLIECARTLWTNAYLYADTNSIDKQKNLRQASGLIHEAVLQAIRGLLPVKSILKEYLNDDEEDEKPTSAKEEKEEEEEEEATPAPLAPVPVVEPPVPVVEAPASVVETPAPAVEEAPAPVAETPAPAVEEAPVPVVEAHAPSAPAVEAPAPSATENPATPMIYVDTKPSVSFMNEHVFFDSNNLEANEIQDIPFAEAELKPPEEDDEEEGEEILITDETLPMEADEILP
jgi:hypothetical protein